MLSFKMIVVKQKLVKDDEMLGVYVFVFEYTCVFIFLNHILLLNLYVVPTDRLHSSTIIQVTRYSSHQKTDSARLIKLLL